MERQFSYRQFPYGLNGNQLKLIAAFSMFADHIGFLLVGTGILENPAAEKTAFWWIIYRILRCLGRVAFPIFSFLLIEGFRYTRDWKKYALRLGIFALISEAPFDMMSSGIWFDPDTQNVFFTLLIGLLMLRTVEYLNTRYAGETGYVLQLLAVFAGCGLAWLVKCDYSYTGVMLIALFYWLREDRFRACILGFLWMILSGIGGYQIPGYVLAFLLLYGYDGSRGSRNGKYFFYLFYPVHILVLIFVYRLMFG